MKTKLTLLFLFLASISLTAQNTVTVQGDFQSGSSTNVYLNCDQSIRTIEVEVLDNSNNPVSGEDVTATIASSGSGTASFTAGSTTTETTDASGIATFDNLAIDENTDITIQFDDTGTGTDTTKTINSLECDVNEVWTNYGGFWNSSDTNLNNTLPDNSHDLLAFEFNGVTYSTGVNDTKLTNNGVSVSPSNQLTIRALPVASLPTTGGSDYYIGLGQLADQINNAVDNGSTNPFEAGLNEKEVASFLTDGPQGLDLGTNATNIPSVTTARFNLSSAGITATQVGDGVPDILVSQTASPSSNIDELEFVDTNGNTVGNIVSLDITNEPVVGNWIVDFYEFDSTQNQSSFVNTQRPIHFFAVDLADFGIDDSNASDADALLYRPNGNSDPAFIAFNEPSLGVATQLSVIQEPASQNCDGTLPSNIQVQLEDQNGNFVPQSGLDITAILDSGPGTLAGTTTQTTDGNGIVTFDDLEFTTGGEHVIRFEFAGLDDGFTDPIADGSGCDTFTWDGSESSAWNDPDNWAPGTGNTVFPDGNNAVEIPDVGSNFYPILTADAGAGDLTMASVASIDLDGFQLALNGTLDNADIATGASIDASAAGSELFMSANALQDIPSGLLEPNVATFIIENAGGVTVNSTMDITEVLDVRQGTLTTNGNITMTCTFSPRETAVIAAIDGSISGDITVEQCFPARRAFRLVSPSTTTTTTIRQNWQEDAASFDDTTVEDNYGTHITGVEPDDPNDPPVSLDGTNGFDWNGSGNISMFTFDNGTQNWENISDTDVNTLTAGEPYRLMIRGARVDNGIAFDIDNNSATPTDTRLRSTGEVLETGDTQTLSNVSQNWNLIGNPYHAPVNMKQLIDNSTNVDRFYTIWDPRLGGSAQDGGRGAFVTYNVDEGQFDDFGASGSTDINNFLQPYQAAFVRTSSDGPASVDFTESMISTVADDQTNTFSSNGISQFPHIYTKLFATSDYGVETPLAVNQIRFNDRYDNAFNQFDAQAFYNVDETLARLDANQIWAIEKRDLPVDDESLVLLTYQYRRTNYTFEFQVGEFEAMDVYLEDTYLDEMHLLEDMQLNTVDFTIDPSVPASVAFDRFNIVFEEETMGIADEVLADQIKLFPNPATDFFTIDLGDVNAEQATFIITDLQGRQVKEDQIYGNQPKINTSDLAQGVYIVKVSTERSSFTDKLIVE